METITSLPSAARRLEGKVAIVTGGASGIGECTAKLFCRHGAKVVIADIQDDKGASICRSLCEVFGDGTAAYVHCDVSDEADVSSAVDGAVSVHGRLDVMFNNAAVGGSAVRDIVGMERSEFERIMATNLTGVFLGTKHAARVMIPEGRGSIITNSSVASVVGSVNHGYVCSKNAVVGLARNAAAELGRHGIRVNCVSPFGVATPLVLEMFQLPANEEFEAMVREKGNLSGEALKAEDVANAVLFLASDESRYVSGHNLVVDGGYTITK